MGLMAYLNDILEAVVTTAKGMRIAWATARTMPMSIGRRSAEAVMS